MSRTSNQKRELKREKMAKKCDFCGMKGHLKDECFKIIGYPDWYRNLKGKGDGKFAGNIVKQEPDEEEDSPLEITREAGGPNGNRKEAELITSVVQEVMKAMNEKKAGSVAGSSFAGSVLSSNINNVYDLVDEQTWIIDTGASDHIGAKIN
ncbi:Terminal uridylyltransferase 7 [Bienertia sinuspersici]